MNVMPPVVLMLERRKELYSVGYTEVERWSPNSNMDCEQVKEIS